MSLLNDASLILTPNAVKEGKLYSVIPSNGNGDMTVVRATTATRVNSSGLIESVAANVPRLNYDVAGGCPSILVEPQRTNRLLNSDVVVTQSITTARLLMAVSFYGTGTITFSGTFVGSLVGTGANNRVSIVFTPTTGTLTLTVTGSVTKGQVETGAYATSYIPTITATTRNADIISKTGISDLIGQTEGTLFCEFALNTSVNFQMDVRITAGTGNEIIIFNTGLRPTVNISSANVLIFSTGNALDNTSLGANNKIAVAYKNNDFAIYQNGVLKFSQSTGNVPLSLPDLLLSNGSRSYLLKNTMLFKTRLTNTELAQLTTL